MTDLLVAFHIIKNKPVGLFGTSLAYLDSQKYNITQAERRGGMTLCPIALVVGCKKCPLVKICPVKEVIGNYKKEDTEEKK